MYYVQSIGIILIVFYILSLLSYKTGIISKKVHKALWNSLLLIAFLFTASAGLFLALQSNYKWDIRGYEKFLSWHVQFGIGMSFTGLIHLSWHLSYFFELFKGSTVQEKSEIADKAYFNPKRLRILLFLLGFITGIAQVVFLKEILNISGGYEFLSAMVLSFWIILSALGVRLARYNSNMNTKKLYLMLPVVCLLSFIIFLTLPGLLLKPGTTPSLIITIIITILSLMPFCVFSGLLFVKLSVSGYKNASFSAGRSYAIETIGGICSGLLITVLSGSILGNYQFILLSGCIYYLVLLSISGSKFRVHGIILTLLLFIMVLLLKPDVFFRNFLLRGINITESIDTKYGNIAISESGGERSIFYNHRLINFEDDIRTREENIHYAMIQHENPENILLLSGGLQNHLPEILKYQSVHSLTYIERDPALNKFQNIIDPDSLSIELNIIQGDAMRFIKDYDKKFDVIISLHNNADNLVTNRFFTIEFFNICKDLLSENGVIMIKAGYGSNYINQEESKALSSIYNSMAEIFNYTLPIRGESIYFLGSDSALEPAIINVFEQREIRNTYVNKDYLDNDILCFNTQQIIEGIDSSFSINTLNRPVVILYKQKYELAKSGYKQIILIVLFAITLLIPFFISGRDGRIMYSSSLNLAGTEILCLLLIQSTSGNIYQLISLVIAVMMAGLALGSFYEIKFIKGKSNIIALYLSVFAIISALLVFVILEMKPGIPSTLLILLIVFIPSVLSGHIYKVKTLGTKIREKVSGIYFADLVGAALGFLIISGLLVPLIGIKSTFLILATMNFASYISIQQIRT